MWTTVFVHTNTAVKTLAELVQQKHEATVSQSRRNLGELKPLNIPVRTTYRVSV